VQTAAAAHNRAEAAGKNKWLEQNKRERSGAFEQMPEKIVARV
jgi:hypothetical protein